MKKIFISCPVTKYCNENLVTNGYQNFLEKLYEVCQSDCENIYLAIKADNYNIKNMASDKMCTLQDYNEMLEADVVIAIPESSQGVAVEIGWASALNKKIIVVLDEDVEYSPLIKAINEVTEAIILKINKKNTYIDIDSAFFEKIKILLDEIDN